FYLIPAAEIVGPKRKAIGIDLRPDILAELENRARRHKVDAIVSTLRANVENTPGSSLQEKSADWVLLANILHQSDPAKVFAEAKRLVFQNGSIAVVEWNTSATPFGPPGNQRIGAEELKKIASAQGLKIVKEFSPSPYHFGLLFQV
ncbi:MAG: class I SAM-dependent methyltransferase, partial [Patescibacteria group bacterium]